MMAKIAPVDSQKRWNEKFIDTIKDLDAAEASLNLNCLQLNTLRVNISSILLYSVSFNFALSCIRSYHGCSYLDTCLCFDDRMLFCLK